MQTTVPTTAPMALTTSIRSYDWGSATALPELLGTAPTGRPQAELWVGAHPAAPSSADGTPLTELIAADPEGMLGAPAAERFGASLPYLLKILAVERPLSLQVHPTVAQAEAGFAAEEARGIPIDDRARSYKDPYHKPEMICAITDFHGLCGFREPSATADLLENLGVDDLLPWAAMLREEPAEKALPTVLAEMLDGRVPVSRVERSLGPVHAGIARAHPDDPGILAALLLNHFTLRPGQAIFLDAGVPHCYLGGLGVEVMANSDNILRCGLTGKHVDVPELLRVVDFAPTTPHQVAPDAGPGGEFRYSPPVRDFALVRHDLDGTAHELPTGIPQALLCVQGEARLTGQTGALTLRPGEAAFVPANASTPKLTGEGTLYRAVPGDH
ncbi:mannose-6-phosphate isomerase, class I [Actinomadura litoris]|nr:mannose-6-phosphate isomerase, class I [Actinomadura litoris]